MNTSDTVWAALIVTGAAFEAYALKNGQDGDTLSEKVRKAFRVRTPSGKLVFGLTWVAFSAWFLGHILWGWDFPLT
jgi:hypothetical protein